MELKEVVYYICRIKGFSFIGKLAYLSYYRLLSLLFWLTPEIRSLYIAGSMASGDFVPGLSDFDFVLVIKEMDTKEEYKFLKSFDKKISYLMPPFGKEKIGTHIFIYSYEEWAIFGDLILGKRFGSARAVFEKENITLKKRYSRFIKGLHHFYKGQWRLEIIQQHLFLPKQTRFSLGFLERAIERCVLSITFGFNESTQELPPLPFYNHIHKQINDFVKQICRSRTKDSFESIFLNLNHLFHFVVENSCRSHPKNVSIEISEIHMSDGMKIQKLRTKELVDEISGVLKNNAETHSILVSRTDKVDYFLFDPRNYEISRSLINYYRNNNFRILRMFSKASFSKLYLNFPIRPVYFFDLHDGTQKILRGYFDSARFIIETYSVLPKVRSPKNFKDPARFKLVQNQILQQINFLEDQTKVKENNDRFRNDLFHEQGINLESNTEYERFNILKTMSLDLRKKIPELFSCLS